MGGCFMNEFRYFILIFGLSFASSFSMNPVVDLTEPDLSRYPKQEYAAKKSGIIRILKRYQDKIIILHNLLARLQSLYDNRDINQNEYLDKKQRIMNKITARENMTLNQLEHIVGHPLNYNPLVNIDNANNSQLERIAHRILE